jgi:hypothetical protein
MERRFNLIKSDFEKHEKRVLPRFPFCYLTFKPDGTARVYEIKDISHTGMQLSLKDEGHGFQAENVLKGHIHWLGKNLDIVGTVKWHTANRIGVEFAKKRDVLEKVQGFLAMEELVKRLKPLHKLDDGLEIPSRLKYWLRSDGPVEVFVWQHGDGEIATCQVLFFETFMEWEDGHGVKTGRILSKRNVDSPLLTEDEWVFQMDADADPEKLARAKNLITHIPDELLPAEVRTFLVRQMS